MTDDTYNLDRAIYNHLYYAAKFGKRNVPIPLTEICNGIAKRFGVEVTEKEVASQIAMTKFGQHDHQGVKHNIPPYHYISERQGGNPFVMTHASLIEQAVDFPAEWKFKPYT